MPQLPPADGVTRAVFNYTSNGIATANVLHFMQPPGPDAPDPTDLASRLAIYWAANMSQLTHSSTALQNVICTDLSTSGPPASLSTQGLPSTGLQTGDGMPNNVTLCLSLKTGLRGRSYRGRIYVPGISESNSAGNAVPSAYRDALVSAWSGLILYTGPVGTPDIQMVVLSYFNAGAIRATPVATPVVSISADTTIDTMRRRMR